MKKNTTHSRWGRGFTLVELIIVIAVIGVLAAILIPTFSNVIDKANAKSALSDARNIVSKYVSEKLLDDTTGGANAMPENFVIAVKKANKYHLFGYNTAGDGSMTASQGNPFNYSDFNTLVGEKSWNGKHAGTPFDQAVLAALENATDVDCETEGYFYYVPTTPVAGSIAVKSFTKSGEAYVALNEKMEHAPKDAIVFHGLLLPGTVTIANGESAGSTGGQTGGTDEGGEGGTPVTPPATMYTITFAAGNGGEGFDASKVTLPDPVQAAENSAFVTGAYSASYNYDNATEDGFIFNGWDEESVIVTGNKTITAQWTPAPLTKYTLTFEAEGATINFAGGFTNGQEIVKGTNILSYITGTSASKSDKTFIGWLCEGVTYTPTSSDPVVINEDMTLVAQFDDAKYSITYEPGEGGTGSPRVQNNLVTGTIPTAYTFAESGFTAPADKVFKHWKINGVDVGGGVALPFAITENLTATAIYIDNTYKIHYDTDMPNVKTFPDDATGTPGVEKTITVGAVANDWYHITGYNIMSTDLSVLELGFAGGSFTIPATVAAGEVVMISVETAVNKANITFTDAGSTANITDISLDTAENRSVTLTIPTKSGFEFRGWNVTSGNAITFSNKVAITDKTSAVVNVEVTANWVAVATDAVYYFGNSYWDATTGKLENGPTLAGTPVNVIENYDAGYSVSGNTLTFNYESVIGTIQRRFTITNQATEINDTNYVLCTEDVDNLVSKMGGATNLGACTGTSSFSATGTLYLSADSSVASWTAYATTFKGSFDGMGYAISGITQPFFKQLNAAKVYGLVLPRANVTYAASSSPYGAAILTTNTTSGAVTIENCHLGGSLTNSSGAYGCGALVGYVQVATTVNNCSSTADVTNSYSSTGGLLGKGSTSYGQLTNCWTTGKISGSSTVGGLAAVCKSLTNCWSTCNIKTTGGQVGGLTGQLGGTASRCWYNGYIYANGSGSSAEQGVGGIAGGGYTGSTKFIDCWTAGHYYFKTTAATTRGLGGIAGTQTGSSNSSGSNVAERCISYAYLYTGSTGNVFPITAASHPGKSGGEFTVNFFVADRAFKSASVSFDNTNFTFTKTSGTVIPLTSLYCYQYTVAYSQYAVTDPADLINTIQTVNVEYKTSGSGYWIKPWADTSAWNLSGTYPTLKVNPGVPTV